MQTPASLRFFSGIGSIESAIQNEVYKNPNWNDELEKRNTISKVDIFPNFTFEFPVDDNGIHMIPHPLDPINVDQLQMSTQNTTLKLNNITFAKIICENDKYWIECESHQLVNIVDVFWGRYENNMCLIPKQNLTKFDFDQSKNLCESKSPKIEQNIKTFCQNEPKCLITAQESFLSKWDCHGYSKYLQVTYQCLHSESRIKPDIIPI